MPLEWDRDKFGCRENVGTPLELFSFPGWHCMGLSSPAVAVVTSLMEEVNVVTLSMEEIESGM